VTATRIATSVNAVSEYQWKAQLTLAADTTYCYRVYLKSTDLLGTGASPQFRTQLPAGSTSPFSFAVFGDWGRAPTSSTNQDLSNVMSRLSESGARFALSVGDNAYESGGQANYGDLYQTGPNISAVFGPQYWAKVGASLPLFAAVGNHGFARSESNLPDLVNWPQDRAVSLSAGKYQKETYCCLNGTSSGSYPSAWYAFDAGNARFYVLTASWTDTNNGTATPYKNDHDYHWTSSSAEYQWLETDLKTHPSPLKFAVFHYPLYSDNTSETSDTYLQGAASLEGLLGRYGVDIAFNGHAHIYQRNRGNADGLVTYVTGGGGAKLSSVRACSAVDLYAIGWSYNDNAGTACGAAPVPRSVDQVYHYLLVSVSGTTVTVTPIDELGRHFDVQTYDFGGAPIADTSPPTAPTALDGFARGAKQVDLVWAASSDNTGVTDYRVFRDGTMIARTGGAVSFSDVGLSPSSPHTYFVQAEDGAGNVSAASSSKAVTTSPAVISPVVVAAGDIACGPTDSDYNGGAGTATNCRQRATSDAVINVAPDEVLALGDTQYETGDPASYGQVYDSTWGRFKAKTQPGVGDHEYQTANAAGYFGYFGAAAGDPVRGFYAYDLGSWRLYALNSNCDNVPCGAGSEQERWLRADLAAHPSSCILAYWHHPLFSSGGSYGRTQPLWQALYEAGGDVVLAGHEHIYERFAPQSASGAADANGIREFVVGTGGKSHHAFTSNPPNSEFRDAATFGVLKLTLRSDGYDWEFVPEAGATLSDRGSGLCDAATDTQAPTAPGNLSSIVRSSTQVDLTWSASTDNVAVTGYDIYRNDALLKTVGTVTSYSDTLVVGGGTYTYKVRARDAAGNLSNFGNAVTVTTPPGATSVMTYSAAADAYVDEGVPLANFGTLSRVYADASPHQQAYLKFAVSGLLGTIEKATLRLYVGDGSADGPTIGQAENGWSETGITWSSKPGLTGAPLADTALVAGGTWLEIDVTSVVTGDADYSFALIATSSDAVSIYSREATTTSLRPQLVVAVRQP
jgi:chitodextrinase